jgi:hypothetical protein
MIAGLPTNILDAVPALNAFRETVAGLLTAHAATLFAISYRSAHNNPGSFPSPQGIPQ